MLGSVLGSLFGRQYTIGELMNIDSGRIGRAGSCAASLQKVYHLVKPEGVLAKFKSFFSNSPSIKVYHIVLKFKVNSEKGHDHVVFIELYPDFSLSNWQNNRVKIYCDCSDFKYRSAYILSHRNSLFLTQRSSIELGPAVNNAPKKGAKTTTLCKHSYAALTWLMNNYSTLMKTV